MSSNAPTSRSTPQGTRNPLQVLERALLSGQMIGLVSRLDAATIRKAHRNRLGLVHAAMRVADDAERNQAVRTLVSMGADLDAPDERNRTALHDAVEGGDLVGVDLLIELGADLDAQDAGGRTALHITAQQGRVRPATRLISAGALTVVRDGAGRLFTDLGDESFAEHMDLLMDVRQTIRSLDRSLGAHGVSTGLPDEAHGRARGFPSGAADSDVICGD